MDKDFKNNLITDEKLEDMTYEEIEDNIGKMKVWLINYWGD